MWQEVQFFHDVVLFKHNTISRRVLVGSSHDGCDTGEEENEVFEEHDDSGSGPRELGAECCSLSWR